MLNVLSLNDIKFGVLDLLRSIGMSLVDTIYSTIDTLYEVGNTINSLNLIQMLQDIDNSPFTKVFNAFFILSFIVLLLFSIWKITFRIIDADTNEEPLFELIKEIIKCGFLIFSVVLIFNTTIDIGSNLSKAVYNNFNTNTSTIGDKMEGAYLTVNEKCYKKDGGEKVDKKNVENIKEQLEGYTNLESVTTVKNFENLIRNNTLSTNDIVNSDAFSERCQIYKGGKNDEDYTFNYNFLFGIVIGVIFLISIGFAVLSLGKRQLELAFLMVIAPLVIATSVGRKEQRSALYQQLASLILQAGALMLLIGLTSITFNAVQNSNEINNLEYFPKIVAQSILYLGCAMLLMTGCNSLNRFIGDNVSANSGRDMLTTMTGIGGVAGGAIGGTVGGAANIGRATRGTYGLGQLAHNFGLSRKNKKISSDPSKLGNKMTDKAGKGLSKIMKGSNLKESSNPISRAYGAILSESGKHQYNSASKKWDMANNKVNENYQKRMDRSSEKMEKGKQNLKKGYGRMSRSGRYYR